MDNNFWATVITYNMITEFWSKLFCPKVFDPNMSTSCRPKSTMAQKSRVQIRYSLKIDYQTKKRYLKNKLEYLLAFKICDSDCISIITVGIRTVARKWLTTCPVRLSCLQVRRLLTAFVNAENWQVLSTQTNTLSRTQSATSHLLYGNCKH